MFSLIGWLNCLRLEGWVGMFLFFLVTMLVFALFSRRLFRSMRGFYSLQEVYGGQLIFF
jgi:hypothetical protein